MIHTNRTVTVGNQESIIDSPIILYRGDREVEVEFTLNGNKFTFTNGGNVIKSTNATHGQLVINTPTGENMFSDITECHEGKVVFLITKEMIDELVEIGFYSFQIRLFDESQVSRVTIPPVFQGIDIRNPIAAEDETNVVDIGLVDYAIVQKDEYENLATFLPDGSYNKTDWESRSLITEAKLDKIEDALYTINENMEASDLSIFNRIERINQNVNRQITEFTNEADAEIEAFERSVNTNVEQFKIDTNAAMTAHKNEVSEELESVNSQLAQKANNVKYIYSKIKADGVTDDTKVLMNEINNLQEFECLITPRGTSLLDTQGITTMKNNVILDFSATSFIEGNTDCPLALKLKNSKIIGLKIDGQRDNKVFDDNNFGTDFLFKIDNGCENLCFEDTNLSNATFCGVMLGENLHNIFFKNLTCSNIGEHVIYKSGYIQEGKNIENFICENVVLNNIGINTANKDNGHTTHLFKAGNSAPEGVAPGYCTNVSFNNVTLTQDNEYVGITIYGGNEIRNSIINNIRGDFIAIHNTNKASNVTCTNSEVSRGFYTTCDTENIVFDSCIFTGGSAHFNLARIYRNCTFKVAGTSSNRTNVNDDVLIFDNCTFNMASATSINYVYTDIIFQNCTFISTATTTKDSGLISIGNSDYIKEGVDVKFINCICASNANFNYLFIFNNAYIRVVINNLIATGRIKFLTTALDANFQNVLYYFENGYYGTVSTDFKDTQSVLFNVRTEAGTILDNYTSKIGGVSGSFTDNQGRIITITNGIITSIN